MKYVWIVILAILYISWAIMSVQDCIEAYKFARDDYYPAIYRSKKRQFLASLHLYTVIFIILHVVILFVYSLSQYVGKPPLGQPLYLVVDSNIKMF